jgi:hypothetical protein
MAWIEHDGHHARDLGFRFRLVEGRFAGLMYGFALDLRLCLAGLFEQCHQWVYGFHGVEVEHQSVAVFAYRLQGKYLRLDLTLEFNHQAHQARLVAPGTDQLDVGIGVENLGRQRLQHGVEFDPFEVEHQALRIP